uniref:autotransporter domain-containing protein n=1 Tax=Sandarakinorhabdus sp. TaxID=1916663 RepID=UPI00334056EF
GLGIIDTQGFAFTLNGVVDGAGSVTKIGSGNLVLNGANTFTGGSFINVGTVTVGNNAALGTALVTMANGTVLANNTNNLALANAFSIGNATIATGSNNFTLNGVVGGSGLLTKTGSGVLVLNGENSYTGGTALTAGTIRVGTSLALGTGGVAAAAGTTIQAGNAGVTLANSIAMAGGMTADNNGQQFGFGGVVSGVGPLTVIDSTGGAAGVLTLSGTNSYTGGTVVNATAVRVAADVNLGNAAGNVTLNRGTLWTTASFASARTIALGTGGGTIQVAPGTAFTVNGTIAGTALTKTGSGELVLNTLNSYLGGTSLNAGTITVANDLALGLGTLAMAGGTTLNTATNLGTTPNSPTVTLANAVTTAGAGTVNANTGLNLVLNGVVSGAGSIAKTGAGLLVLNGANSFGGGTALVGGTIRTGTGTALGTGVLTTTGGTTLQAGNAGLTVANAITLGTGITTVDTQAFTYTLSGVASGVGGVSKIGAGILNLTAASTYTGATTVAAGTLNVTGSLVSAVTVNSGAALTGTGTVGALNVLAGGLVAPGAPGTTDTATITVTGAATLAGTYTANITTSTNDRISAGGVMTVGGTLAVVPTVPASFSQFNQSFTVASGSSLTGTFATVSGLDQFGIAFAPVVSYTATQANIRLAPQSLEVLGNRFGGVTGNALEVARAFDRAVAGGYNPQAFFNVYANGGSALPLTLRQMSGEQRATERRVVLDTNRVFRESALDRLNSGTASLGGQQVSTSDGDRTLTFWLRGAGSWGKAQTNGAATAFTTEQRGVITGLDWAKNGVTVGGMFHYTSTDIEYRLLAGSSTVETVGGTVYGGYRRDGGVVVNGGISISGARTNGSRAITLPGFAQSLAGTTNGNTYQFFGEAAYDLAASADTRIEPFARLAYVKADIGTLAETGGVAALAAGKQGYDITVINLGARVGANVAGGKVALNAGASWQGTSGDRDAATVIGIPAVGQNGLIRSVQIDRSALSLQADAGVNLSQTIRFSLGYSGLIGKRNDDHGGRATLNVAF